jgi:serine/threonine protein kinase
MDSNRPGDNKITNALADADDKFATTRESATGGAPLALQLKSVGSRTIPFGRYEILRILGEGAMGSVYLAQDTVLQRQVAIKVPKLDDSDSDHLERFYREARTMATLRHPHLCPVFDVGEFGGVHYFTMAYIEGGTLVDYLIEGEGLPDRQVARLIAKTASALDTAHKTGIIHRDLKPANIMIDRNKEPVVMDFGLAGVVDTNANLTQWGQMLGTPAYMAPEQILGDLDLVGPASDVYSLGAIMYQMLTGRTLYDGSISSVIRQALESEPDELASLANHVDSELSAICSKALSKEPQDRYASANELANALRDFLLGKSQAETRNDAADLAALPTVNSTQLDRQAARIRKLWGEARYADALPILEEIARQTDESTSRYADWAREEIPKVQAKIKQAESSDDWLPSVNVVAPVHLGSPKHYQRSGRRESIPPWLMWAMAVPVVVIVFLIVLVIATSWKGSNRSRQTIATNPTDGQTKTQGSVDSTPSDPASKNVAAQSKQVASEDESGLETSEDPTTDLSPTADLDGQTPREELPTYPSPNHPSGEVENSNPPPCYPPLDNGGRPSERGGPPPHRPPHRDALDILMDFDLNFDGQLTLNEIPFDRRPHLMRGDTDGDQILTRQELEVLHPRRKPWRQPR